MIETFERAELTPNSLSVKVRMFDTFTNALGDEVELQVDPQGNPTPNGNRRAIGLGDFAEDPANPSSAEKTAFNNEVKRLVGSLVPTADLLATISRLRDERDALRAARPPQPVDESPDP